VEGSKMKNKKFERVVTWEQEPNWYLFGLGVILFVLFILGILFGVQVYIDGTTGINPFFSEDAIIVFLRIYAVIGCFVCFTGGIYFIQKYRGEGKKICWKEVK